MLILFAERTSLPLYVINYCILSLFRSNINIYFREKRIFLMLHYFIRRIIRVRMNAGQMIAIIVKFFFKIKVSYDKQLLLHFRHAFLNRNFYSSRYSSAKLLLPDYAFANDNNWPVFTKSVYQFPRALRTSL